MESNSKDVNMDFPSFDFNDIELYDGNTMVHNETDAVNFPKPDDPTFTESSITPKTPVDVEGELPSQLATNDQPQLDQVNSNADAFGFGNDQVENNLVPSGGSTNESFVHDPNLGQPMYSGFDGNGSSLGHDGAHQPPSPDFSPLIMEPTNSFPMALAEQLPQDGGFSAPPFYSEQRANSVQPNQANGHIGSSMQAALQGSQRVEPTNQGNGVMFSDQFQQNNGNNNSMVNQQQIPFTTMLSQTSTGMGYLNGGGSTQMNQPATNWTPYKENNYYRPSGPSGSPQVNQFRGLGNSDPRSYNGMPSRAFAPLRPQQLNNTMPMLHQGPNMPNASNSLLQNSMMNKHPMPFQHAPQNFPYQPDQVPMTPGAYNPQAFGTRLPESSSMPLRTPMLPPRPQVNPFDMSDLQYRNSFQPRPPMLPSNGFMLQDANDHRRHQFNQFNPMPNQFNTQSGNSMMQDSLMNSSPYPLPLNQPQQQANSQFSMMPPCLPNVDQNNFRLPENPFLPGLQLPHQQQEQGLFDQTSRPISTYGTSGASITSMVFNSLIQNEANDASANQAANSRGRRGPAPRSRFSVGEPSSSSFKRFRREDPNLPEGSNAAQDNLNLFSQNTQASTSSTTSGNAHPKQIKNAVYDPLFEGIGLPIDPHLRIFATL